MKAVKIFRSQIGTNEKVSLQEKVICVAFKCVIKIFKIWLIAENLFRLENWDFYI